MSNRGIYTVQSSKDQWCKYGASYTWEMWISKHQLIFSFYPIYSHWLKALSWRFHVISLRMLIIHCMFDRTLFLVHCHVSLLFKKTLANNPLNLVCHIRVKINCILIKRLNNNWNWYPALYIVVKKN
jgi:hypothetical protein